MLDVVHDDLSREVYGILGMPLDVVDLTEAVRRIHVAAQAKKRYFISTPNLNFGITTLRDPLFRDSLLKSDLCTIDGMPLVWIARLLGISHARRVAGSDLFDAIKQPQHAARPLKVFFFGGDEGVAAQASKALNSANRAAICVGFLDPGRGSVETMSTEAVMDKINHSEADFLLVALGASKGQAWLMRNQEEIRAPVRSHLGATIGFQAGTLTRAPIFMQRMGLEWLWRIKEEPQLWRRYWNDGTALLSVMLFHILPQITNQRLDRFRSASPLSAQLDTAEGQTKISLYGDATQAWLETALPVFRQAADLQHNVILDLTRTQRLDIRFLGSLLMLRKILHAKGRDLKIVGPSTRLARGLRTNGFAYLLD